jgi:hypothetical protein
MGSLSPSRERNLELKNFFPQDEMGNAIVGASCYLYERGNENIVDGLLKANGESLSNPFVTDQGLVQFSAPNGLYDLRVVKDSRDYRIRLQFNDVAETVTAAATAADRAEVARDAAQSSVHQLSTDLADPRGLKFVGQVSVYTDLRLIVPEYAGQRIQLGAYRSGSGEGGGEFIAVNSNGTENYGSICRVNASWFWLRVSFNRVTPLMFGGVGDGVANDSLAVQRTLDAHKYVTMPMGRSFAVGTVAAFLENQNIRFEGGAKLIGAFTLAAAAVLSLIGNYATIEEGFVNPTVEGSYGVQTFGFRNYLENVTVSGTSERALWVNGLETSIRLGKYRGASIAGIYISKPDCYLQNVYIEGNRDGLFASGVGSITAHHVHSFGNTRHNFYLSGASFSQLTACYADTAGANGWEIRDSTSGLTLVDCWGYKSSNGGAGLGSDFFVFNANVTFVGGRASGQGAFAKTATLRIAGTSKCSFDGFYADSSAPVSIDNPNLQTFSSCKGQLKRYNRPDRNYVGGSEIGTIAAAGMTTPTLVLDLPSSFVSPGVLAFEISLIWRATSGNQTGFVKHMVMVGTGGASSSVTLLANSIASLSISSPSILEDSSADTQALTFTVNNALAYGVQVGYSINFLGTSRGYL